MTFTPAVYEAIREGAKRSAAAVVPYVWSLVTPSSVADVGGGEGWWGREFFAQGCKDVTVFDESYRDQGLVGVDIAIQADRLLESRFIDLNSFDTIGIPGRYDLALCLEVAEHVLPEYAEALVNRLVQLAPVVLFSAAIPAQGGHGHVNEQWPSYWASLFMAHGYFCSDSIRWKFWDDERVEPWYAQNMMVFGRVLTLTQELGLPVSSPAPVVHPTIYQWRLSERAELEARLG